MTTIRVDLASGARTYTLPLEALPFQSSLGPATGTLALESAPDGRLTSVLVTMRAEREAVVRELDRLAAAASWPLPKDEIRASREPSFVVSLALRPEALAQLPPFAADRTEQRLEPARYRAMLEEANYTVENIEIAEGPR